MFAYDVREMSELVADCAHKVTMGATVAGLIHFKQVACSVSVN